METGTETAIARLLTEAGAAHGEYETTALGGVYDENWPGWYATYLLGHGLPDLLPAAGNPGAAELGAILTHLDADFRQEQPAGDWPAYYAERLGAMITSPSSS